MLLLQREIKGPKPMIAMVMAGFLGACGGGEGGLSAVPEMTNRAPVFDEESYELTIRENTARSSAGFHFGSRR